MRSWRLVCTYNIRLWYSKSSQSTSTMPTSQGSISSANDDHSDGSLQSVQDDTISSTEYAHSCREFLELLKDLKNLEYAPLT